MSRRIAYLLLIVLASLTTIACQNASTTPDGKWQEEAIPTRYASGFTMWQGEGYRRIEIVNPWDTTRLLRTYILVDANDTLPSRLPEGKVVRTPLRNVLVFSSVHCSLLRELNALDAIGGICDSEYVYVDELQRRLQAGTLADAGNSTAPDIEKIIELNPDAILLSPFENLRHERLENTQIPIIECADYMELSPLGRAEWMKVIGLLMGCESVADSLFAQVERDYLATCQHIAVDSMRPSVITERRTGSVWYMPGGKSYMARLLWDAGANYLWSDNENTGSIPLSFESVLERGQSADFWLIKYHAEHDMTYRTLADEFAANTRFKAFEQGKVYGCNTLYHRYYEETPFHPERLLQDLAAIFHPTLYENYTPYYFSTLANE